VFDETKSSQLEQLDLYELDDEEAPCTALRNMSIGDVYAQELQEPTQAQDQPSSFTQASPLTQDEEQAQEDGEQVQDNEKLKMEAYIKGEKKKNSKIRRMIKRYKQQGHHTQDSITLFKETTPST
jgi:2-oxoglutarate dehydrogenase complex dehydrogenase (E1) component-like enzyme